MMPPSARSCSDHPKEACGVFGVFGIEEAAPVIYQGLFALQHRGQEGAGVVVSDGSSVRSHKGQGLLSEVFAGKSWSDWPGHLGIGHVRYSTTGSSRVQNVQPLVVECVDGIWAVAHNGNLTNAARLRRMYQDAGAIFQTSTDSEVLVHLLADPMYRSRPSRVARAPVLPQVDALPDAERERAVSHGNHQARGGEDRAHVRRHVVGSFVGVVEEAVAVGDEARHERLEVAAHRRVGVLAQDQRGAGVVAVDVAEPGGDAGFPHCRRDLAADLQRAAPAARDRDGALVHPADPSERRRVFWHLASDGWNG